MSGERVLLAGLELGGTKALCTPAHDAAIVEQQRLVTRDPTATLTDLRAILGHWRGASPPWRSPNPAHSTSRPPQPRPAADPDYLRAPGLGERAGSLGRLTITLNARTAHLS